MAIAVGDIYVDKNRECVYEVLEIKEYGKGIDKDVYVKELCIYDGRSDYYFREMKLNTFLKKTRYHHNFNFTKIEKTELFEHLNNIDGYDGNYENPKEGFHVKSGQYFGKF